MASTDLTASSPVPLKPTTPRPRDHIAASLSQLKPEITARHGEPLIKQARFPVRDGYEGSAHGFLHLPSDLDQKSYSKTAAILLSGAGGGVTGPSGMYLSLGTKLPALSARIPTLRLDYRYPAHTKLCVADTKAAMQHLQDEYGITGFILVGWSFGGAPVFTIAGRDERVVGAATVASQTADAMKGARECGRRKLPVLLLHGTDDRTLSPRCSGDLYWNWCDGYKGEDEDLAKVVLLEGDDHALSKNAKQAEEAIARFIVECAGSKQQDVDEKVVKTDILKGAEERKEAMQAGGDLRGKESIE